MNLGNKFYSNTTQEAINLVKSSTSFSAIGVSDFGRTVFLKHLSNLPLNNKFIFVDIYDLASYSRIEFFKLLLKQLGSREQKFNNELEVVAKCREQIAILLKKEEKLVIIINRLDLVSFKFSRDFFDNFRSLRMVDSRRIIFIFGVCSPIHTLASTTLLGTDILLYSQIHYLPLYSKEDLKIMANTYGPYVSEKEILNQAAELSGGHFQLFQLLLKNNLQKNLLQDDFIKLAIKNLLRHLNHSQIKILERVAAEKEKVVDDPYLLSTRMVQKDGQKLRLFSPLVKEYLLTNIKTKLPVKENKLFILLKNNFGKMVTRDEIFAGVWEKDPDDATDWALDALAYRLRKNPAFKNMGYILENHKKQGYTLIKE
jgi:hypothetical protein